MDTYRPLDSFVGVGEGQTAVVALQSGPTYDEIYLEFPHSTVLDAEFTADHITGIRLNLNTEDIIDCKGSDLLMIDGYESNFVENGRICIPLRKIMAKSFDGDHSTGLVTLPGDAISLEVDIAGTGASAVVTLKAFADTSPSRNVREWVPRLRRYPWNVGAGENELTTLPRGPRYRRVHFEGGVLVKLTIEKDQVKQYELTKARADYVAKRHNRTPQPGWFHFDPVVDGYVLAKAMSSLSQSLVFRGETSGAGIAHALVESVSGEAKPFVNDVKANRRKRK